MTTEEKYLMRPELFQKKGFSGARMQEIADEAGINKAMLHYF
jgi:AcrR family transcriptional regulator